MVVAELQKLVWDFRHKYSPWWATPTPLDAARFAMMEACEALDAYIRLDPAYSRNNQKDLSVQDELADCAMMLVSIQERPIEYEMRRRGGVTIDDIVIGVAYAYERSSHFSSMAITNALDLIYSYDDMDIIYERVASRLMRIKNKHVPVEEQ